MTYKFEITDNQTSTTVKLIIENGNWESITTRDNKKVGSLVEQLINSRKKRIEHKNWLEQFKGLHNDHAFRFTTKIVT